MYLIDKIQWCILCFAVFFLTSTGLPDTQRNRDTSWQCILSVKLINQIVDRHSAHQNTILHNSCKCRIHARCSLAVIKSGDQDIFSYFETTFFTNTITGKCHFVVGEDNSLGIWIIIEEFFNLFIYKFWIITLCDHLGIDRKMIFRHHFKISIFTFISICILCRTGYKKYFLTIVFLGQMLHDQLDALSVVTDQRMAVMRMDDLRKEHGRNGIEFAGKFLSSLIF